MEQRLAELVPAGGHTYSKGMDQFPANAPGLIKRGEGAYCWDADGAKFLDYGMGLRSIGIGHANKEVNAAVTEELANGTNFTRPSVLELELAEIVTKIIPAGEMVKFCKNGSDATSASVRLARAYTGKKYIAICKQHPFYSFNDWFIGATLCNNGIPQEVRDLTVTFNYNDLQSLEDLYAKYHDDIACVILEPVKDVEPKDDFLKKLRALTSKKKTVLIFDEMISGFRWNLKGAQFVYDVTPDLATFGKAVANGFSCSFIVGKKDIMNLGGLTHKEQRVFLLSGTHGAESSALAAAKANIRFYQEHNVTDHHWNYGKKFKEGINRISQDNGIRDYFFIDGFECSPMIRAKNKNKEIDLRFLTLFSQEMIKQGILMPWIAFSYSHGEKELEMTLEAMKNTLKVYTKALEEGVEKYLVGPAVKPVWRQYN